MVESLHSLPGTACLLTFCKYDTNYTWNKKKNDVASFVRYYVPNKGWRTCTWGGDDNYDRDVIFTRMADRLMCFYSNQFLTSDKGYEWKRHPENLCVTDFFHLEDLSIFASGNGELYISQDATAFKELLLDVGQWKYFCAGKTGMMSVYSPNRHETFLRLGASKWITTDNAE